MSCTPKAHCNMIDLYCKFPNCPHGRLTAADAQDKLVERSVGAMAIAEGTEGHQAIPRDCPMLVAVGALRDKYDALRVQGEGPSAATEPTYQDCLDTYTLEDLATWLDRKYLRHNEPCDMLAAKAIRDFRAALRGVEGGALGWVPVAERLPPDGGEVLLVTDRGSRSVGFYRHGDQSLGAWGWCASYRQNGPITHWHPLPKSPPAQYPSQEPKA